MSLKPIAILCATLVVAAAVYADTGSDDTNTYNETLAQRSARLMAEYRARRKAALKERSTEMHVFKRSDGSVLLTNQGQKYLHRPGYTEIKLKFEPITVANRYKNRSVNQYTSSDIAGLVKNYSRRYGLDPNLVFAVIKVESNFNPNAVSSAGARGLMQLMPDTASDMGVTRIHDPAQNIAGGTQYLCKCLQLFHGNLDLALAAYNAGPQAVKDYKGVPPFTETRDYVKAVKRQFKAFSKTHINPVYLARAGHVTRTAQNQRNRHLYSVHFKSGLVQPADKVLETQEGYYQLQFHGRAWQVPKDLVKKIVEPT